MSPSKAMRAVLQPRRTMMAFVLGTALSTFSGTGGAASPDTLNDISRYCTACWRNARLPADCWGDCTQEVFSRLMERLSPDSWGDVLKLDREERRELMRAIDAVKKRSQRARKRYTSLNDDACAAHTL